MIKNITKLVLPLALLAGSLSAQYRQELNIPVQGGTNPNIVADVSGNLFGATSLVGFQAREGTFTFGSGTLQTMNSTHTTPLWYYHGSLLFVVVPQFPWGAWAQGHGGADFYM